MFMMLLLASYRQQSSSVLVGAQEGEGEAVANNEEQASNHNHEETITRNTQEEEPAAEVPPPADDAPIPEEQQPQEKEVPPVEQVQEVPPQEESPLAAEEEVVVVEKLEEEASPSPMPDPKEGPPEDEPEETDFSIQAYECVAPRGRPSPRWKEPKTKGSVITLCIKAITEGGTIGTIYNLDYTAVPLDDKTKKISQSAIRQQAATNDKTQPVCPMEDTGMCVAATKLQDSLFEQESTVKATGEALVQIGHEQRRMEFQYDFKGIPPPPGRKLPQSVEHDFYEFPATPPTFPCGPEIRLWLIGALVLTLLEFAFSPSSSDSSNSSANSGADGDSGKDKKKKPKKE
jgi:hypothetical protein